MTQRIEEGTYLQLKAQALVTCSFVLGTQIIFMCPQIVTFPPRGVVAELCFLSGWREMFNNGAGVQRGQER